MLLLVIPGCGQSYNLERDKDCPSCDLIGVQLENADLSEASISFADLTGANLGTANLPYAYLPLAKPDGVIDADFTGALNVPAKYRKR